MRISYWLVDDTKQPMYNLATNVANFIQKMGLPQARNGIPQP